MNKDIIQLLQCPECYNGNSLATSAFKKTSKNNILDGIVWCKKCLNWYPIENTLLELLPAQLAYIDDRKNFIKKYLSELKSLGLNPVMKTNNEKFNLQLKQQAHSDWFAFNEKQTYTSYENTPFWLAADSLAFEKWRNEVCKGKWFLDVGCAQGRSTFKLMDLDLNVVAFDISKKMIREAIVRYQDGNYRANATFFVADATHFPFADESFDYVLLYGVLHHLPDPAYACQEITRVLKSGGSYFGQENNHTIFRTFFDFLQMLFPQWYEEAGPVEMFSSKQLIKYFQHTDISIKSQTSIFLPPHLINPMGKKCAKIMLNISDKIGRSIPFLRNNGGAILIQGTKKMKRSNLRRL